MRSFIICWFFSSKFYVCMWCAYLCVGPPFPRSYNITGLMCSLRYCLFTILSTDKSYTLSSDFRFTLYCASCIAVVNQTIDILRLQFGFVGFSKAEGISTIFPFGMLVQNRLVDFVMDVDVFIDNVSPSVAHNQAGDTAMNKAQICWN